MKITVFGTGYVGLVTAACLADLGHSVTGIDIDAQKITALQRGELWFYEPGLKELIRSQQKKERLHFTTDIGQSIHYAEIIFNCVGTPSSDNGNAELKHVFAVAEAVAAFSNDYKVLVNKSTVPPGTARQCDSRIKQLNPSSKVDVVSNPEFLKEGNAVHDFTHPDRIVIGTSSDHAKNVMKKVYTGLIRTYLNIVETDWETAEMIKYANNAYLATKISFINEIANICDIVGADVKEVTRAMGMDYRINPKFMNAGVGYGGSCFRKDIKALIHRASEEKYNAQLLNQVEVTNEQQKKIIVNKVKKYFQNNYNDGLQNKTLSIFGLSFKPKTSDIREAPSLYIIPALIDAGALLKAYDPAAMPEFKASFSHPLLSFCDTILETVKESSGVILLTEWDEFRNISFSDLGKHMKNKVVFDGRNIYEPSLVREEGFDYYGIGRGN